ncbi:MAG: hypothetical protein LBH15_04955 [Treponema sp.]|jgi:hypothetical protein|nr:hypothetical protein [Treponema sp.]
MKRKIRLPFIFYALFCICGSLPALGEKILVVGGEAGWDAAVVRQGVAETPSVRSVPVMALAAGRGEGLSRGQDDAGPDLALGFDEGRPDLFSDRAGRYLVISDRTVSAVTQRWARTGTGAVHFSGSVSRDILTAVADAEPLVIAPLVPQALLAPDRRIGDFTLEFWLNGENMENGEQVLFWSSTRLAADGTHSVQRIQAFVSRNRLQWAFQNFFADPQDRDRLSLSFSGITPVTPRTWTHHLIRFDSGIGFLEYLVDGRTESVVYATSSGREGGEVFTPVTGLGSRLVLGARFTGIMDEFRLYSSFVENPPLQKYPRGGGRLETRFLDLGEGNSAIARIDARGGRVSYPAGKAGGRARVIADSGAFSFPDDSAIRFFARTSETPFPPDPGGIPWIPFEPGADLENLRGRYLQLAAEFYPSGDGETTPYLEELRVTYIPDGPPRPPSVIAAVPLDGAVELSWNNSADRDTAGYLVYYGNSKGDFFGDDAILGVSPIDVGKRNSVRIEGLSNGVLYYFAVSAYDRVNPAHTGDFSREVSARPLRMVK